MIWNGNGVLKIGNLLYGKEGAVFGLDGKRLKDNYVELPVDKMSSKQKSALIDKGKIVEGKITPPPKPKEAKEKKGNK